MSFVREADDTLILHVFVSTESRTVDGFVDIAKILRRRYKRGKIIATFFNDTSVAKHATLNSQTIGFSETQKSSIGGYFLNRDGTAEYVEIWLEGNYLRSGSSKKPDRIDLATVKPD
ncbi:MAG: hypothetical protein IPJ30_08975 [Acidobacteria bacterium]|nr:hypothetical protein [Acidobacteriota bacterium]